jgi:tetratricopeptide (TPR) repeat protein/transglutaminase-like putative cysteine protease
MKRATMFFWVVVLWLAAPRVGRADGAIDPEVERLSGRVGAAKGWEKQVALLELFSLWDQADPRQIEQVLAATAADKSLPAPTRVYATILVAKARERRGDTAGAAKRMGELGFIDRWLFVGPFDNQNREGFGAPFQPEAELTEPIVPGRSFDGKLRPVRFRNTEGRGGAVFDFGDWVRPREEACGYAVSILTAKPGTKADRPVSFFFGTGGAFKAWLNGKPLVEDKGVRAFDFDRFAAGVSLAPGKNRLTVKVCNDIAAPVLAVRLADAQGNPDLGWSFSDDPSDTAGNAVAKELKPNAKVVGIVQALDASTAGAKASARELEAYARYLSITGGSPRGSHTARDLATRAAKAEPSWQRALLASRLVENANGARVWIDEAAGLVGKGDPRGQVAVLLAKAELARAGINPSDARPLYEEVLALDPANVPARLGKASLFAAAGLPRTALGALEEGVTRSPASVALLRAYAEQLRSLGRNAEADEVDAKWFAFRSDDPGFVVRRLDRAVASGDKKAADRWIARLERVEPDAIYARLVIARAYRSLGEPLKSRLALESALDLAPEDQHTLRALADLAGEEGNREGQLKHLRKILQLYPQAKEVRAYVEMLSPPTPRKDEAYAWGEEQIAKAAEVPAKKGERSRILRRLTVKTIFANGLATRFYQVVMQPLTDEAAAEARQYITSYEGDRQEISLRLSRVYRKDGSVAEAIESGEGAANNPAIAMYTSVRTFAVTFPKLSPGDVIELRYRVDDVAAKNDVADAFYDVEYLQDTSPIGESELVVITPKSRQLQTLVANLPGTVATVTEDGDQKVHRFFAKDVPASVSEPRQPQLSESLGQVHLSTFKTWDEVGKWYWGLARDQLDVDDNVRKKVAELTKDKKTEREKVEAVYHYATSLRYVALELGLEGIKPRRCALTMARGWGDCKDKATIIVTMLRELGIPSTLVLVRTAMRGDLPKDAPPSLGVFDHAIAYVPSLDLYLDGTAEGHGTGELPAMDRGSVALQINEGKGKLVRLPDPKPEASPTTRKLEAAVAADGAATFAFEASVQGVLAPGWRDRYQSATTRRDRVAQDLAGFLGAVELSKDGSGVTVKGAGDVEGPFTLSAKGKAAGFARKEGQLLSMPVATSQQLTASFAALSTRKTDVVVGAQSLVTEERVLKLPAGAKIDRMPEDVKVDGPFGTVTLSVKQEGSKVTVSTKVSLAKSRVSPQEYAEFRAFCQKVDAALGQRLAIRL